MPIGRLDHYSIRTLDMRKRLGRHKVPFRERTVPSLGLHQVFIEDPSQVTIELNYPASEAGKA
jgi:hypothetical protein